MSAEPSSQDHKKRAEWLVRLSGASVIDRKALRYARELIGRVEGRTCLLVTGDSGGLALQLCGLGGTWHSLHTDQAGVDLFAGSLGGEAGLMAEDRFPVGDASFDAVVVYKFLEYQDKSEGVISECHRVLKDNGRLVIMVPQAKAWAAARSVVQLFRLGRPASRAMKPFTVARMFDAMKDGFDMEEQRSHSRFLLELLEALARGLASGSVRGMRRRAQQMGMAEENDAVVDRVLLVRKLCYPLLVVGNLLDGLLFFTSGYYLLCRGRRRLWRPRRAPVLTDGRSIADATINTRIGTAAPF
jgi:SAM-dependent methyltransferase